VRCQTDFCVLNVTAKEPLPAPFVVALASAPSQVCQSALVKNATEAAMSVAMFVAGLARLNGKLNLIQPKRRVDSTLGAKQRTGSVEAMTAEKMSLELWRRAK
jgi:hypothetical protein